MKLALYKGKGTVGNAIIRWWTKSAYSHCELVIGDVSYSSSLRDGGVRAKRIDYNPDRWDFVDLPWGTENDVQMLYAQTKDEPYGWLDLLWRQVFNRPGDSIGWFCSEWCAAALGLPAPQSYSPATLGEYCRMRLK